MLLHVQGVLDSTALAKARRILASADWADGRITAGEQSARMKNNRQLPETSEATIELQRLALAGLQGNPLFFSAALPRQISPPLFNRYDGEANSFGDHVDSAVRYLRDGAGRVRTDISCTLFLAEPDEYDGGELVIADTYGSKTVKLPAGDLVLYPGNTVHRVEPVTRGVRLASYFWVQSMVRSAENRRLLFDMDQHLISIRSRMGESDPAVIGLTATYHNLLRMWLEF